MSSMDSISLKDIERASVNINLETVSIPTCWQMLRNSKIDEPICVRTNHRTSILRGQKSSAMAFLCFLVTRNSWKFPNSSSYAPVLGPDGHPPSKDQLVNALEFCEHFIGNRSDVF
jgi:hypothetical protein